MTDMAARVDARALDASLRRLSQSPSESGLRDALHEVLEACVHLFEVSGSGLMMADEQGVLRYVVATDGPSQILESVQLEHGTGPCVDAFVQDELVVSSDLNVDPRWPEVAARVAPHGVVAVLGAPIHLGRTPVGSLDVYVGTPCQWDAGLQRALRRYGEVIDAMLAAALAAERAGELADQLNYALDYRAPIERGVGYLMARDGLNREDAFRALRTAARSSRRKIGDVAEDLLSTGLLPDEGPRG